jgi:hypothetical protein
MILTGRNPRLTIDNKIAELCEPTVDDQSADQFAEQMVYKLNLISSIHVAVLYQCCGGQEEAACICGQQREAIL